MQAEILVLVALLGLILGSFLNALLFRYNTGRSIIWARSTSLRASRSACMHCGHTLQALDLVPLLSYAFLGGRCRYCHSCVSVQYPLVEAVSAVLAVLTYLQNPEPVLFFFWLAVWMLLLFIAVYDLRHFIIPFSASVPLALLALGYAVWIGLAGDLSSALLAGPSLAAPFFLISLLSRERLLGWGDGGLELSLGWLLGLTVGISAIVIGCVIGSLLPLVSLVSKKRFTMKSKVPFAPLLILGAAAAYFLHVDFFSQISVLWS